MKVHSPLKNSGAKNVIAACSSRQDGNMSLVHGDSRLSLANRRKFLTRLGIPAHELVCARQVHGKKIEYVNSAQSGSGALSYDSSLADTDGFITDVRRLPLAVFTADCLSVFIYDPQKPAIGLLHAGWRSSEENIAGECVKLMREKFGSAAQGLLAGFGPGIRACCCEVSEGFKSSYPSCLLTHSGKRYLDIAAVNRIQLMAAGLRESNILDARLCTSCGKEDFFSFRREKEACGRMLCVAMLS